MCVFRFMMTGLLAGMIVCAGAQTTRPLIFAGGDNSLPRLEPSSGKGLKIECQPVEKQFVVGQPVNILCTVTNSTDSTKPIGWHPRTGLHFCLVAGDEEKMGGILPDVLPRLRKPVLMKSKELQQGYILFLPPRESMQFVLTYKPDRPEKFNGRVAYDPIAPRGVWIGPKDIADELVFSNPFEYEVGAAGEK